jgi:PadR family transcriptional regulator PadR
LHKLEKENLIKGTWEQETQKRKRKYYSITKKGREHILKMLTEWKNFYKYFFDITGEIET